MADRVSQVGIQIIEQGPTKVRTSQVGIQVILQNAASTRLSQCGIQVIIPFVTPQVKQGQMFVIEEP